jgi:hypothetical protein
MQAKLGMSDERVQSIVTQMEEESTSQRPTNNP